MDSPGLANAITQYWQKTYPDSGNNETLVSQLTTVDGIKRHIKKALSCRSARTWLAKLGWNWREVRSAIYKDGHERQDVLEYRQDIFLPRMESLKPSMMESNEQ